MSIETNHIATKAGAYIIYDGSFAFAMGPDTKGDHLGLVRLGGHCEDSETSWPCAKRELMEEASISVEPLTPPGTYKIATGSSSLALEPISWTGVGPQPLLVTDLGVSRKGQESSTIVYLVRSLERPVPASETQGIVLLTPAELATLCNTTLTLGQFLETGGRYITRYTFSPQLELKPSYHLYGLLALLNLHPELGHL